MYLITGATGAIGSRIVSSLLAAGESVRVVSRRPSHTAALPTGVDAVAADLTDLNTHDRAVDGVHTIFLNPRATGAVRGQQCAHLGRADPGRRHRYPAPPTTNVCPMGGRPCLHISANPSLNT
jgi:uncharacterized protein YbjT (DUF2867 family)